MSQAIDQSGGQHGITEELGPPGEFQIGTDDGAGSFNSIGYDLKQEF